MAYRAQKGLGAALLEACVEHIYDEAHDVFEAMCLGGISLQVRSTEMTSPSIKAAHSLQWEPADLEKVDAAAKAVHESRSLFVRKAALARAAEVEAGRERQGD